MKSGAKRYVADQDIPGLCSRGDILLHYPSTGELWVAIQAGMMVTAKFHEHREALRPLPSRASWAGHLELVEKEAS